MGSLKQLGKCRICGYTKELTEEHIPPQKAFNDSQVLMHKIDTRNQSNEVRFAPAGQLRQGGYRVYTLCADCNNNTGSWYGNAYVRFARACAGHANQANANRVISIGVSKLFPLRVVKQALTIMSSCCSYELTERHEDLRHLILNKMSHGLPYPLRLFAYLKCDQAARSTGRSLVERVGQPNVSIVAEFSWWPLGWILSFNDLPVEDTLEVTNWADSEYSDTITSQIHLPCHWAATPWPLDYRSPEQVMREIQER